MGSACTLRIKDRLAVCVGKEEEDDLAKSDACEQVVCAFRAETEREMAEVRFRATESSRVHVQLDMIGDVSN